MNEPAICVNCKWCLIREPRDAIGRSLNPPGVRHLCKHPAHCTKEKTDYVTGVVTKRRMLPCEQFNIDGNCKEFEPMDAR